MLAIKLFALGCILLINAQANAANAGKPETTRINTLSDVREKYKREDSHFVDLEGLNVHYRDSGNSEGPTLLLIHGTLGDTSDWDGWVKKFEHAYRVIRLDLPGFGLSGDVASGNYSVGRHLNTIDVLMDRLGEERFAIAGISYGGIIAFRYAATRRDRVDAMLLINSAGIQAGKAVATTQKKRQSKQAKRAPKGNLFTSPVVTTDDVTDFYRAYINDPKKRTDTFIQRKLDMLNIEGRDAVGQKGRALYERVDPKRVLGRVTAPSAILWGQGNKALDLTTANLFMDYLSHSCHKELHTFKSGGHYINVEKPKATAKTAKRFFDKALLAGIPDCD